MSRNRTLTSIITSTALLAGIALIAAPAPAASALPGPVAQANSGMVSATSLPTVQIDGVAWNQEVVGNTVYVTGRFNNARPAGAAAGTNQSPRGNILSYDITTGILNTNFAPSLNNQAYVSKISPDGTRLYVGGQFTQANGVNRYRLAAFDTANGQLISTFAPTLDYIVKAILVTNDAVYVGGGFTTVNGVTRNRLAAFSPVDGSLLDWNPDADHVVNDMVLSPDGSRILIGGQFQNVGGVARKGLAAISPTTGVPLNWGAINNTIYNSGDNAAILDLDADANAIYGVGYVFGSAVDGNLEGAFSADPISGAINWVENCHGDHYGVWSSEVAVYTVSHAHYCTPIGGFFQSDPWQINMRYAIAFTPQATGTASRDEYAGGTYVNFEGTPSPSMINWFPDFTPGTFTGQNQAGWTINGNSQYVVVGGEFPRVNNIDQQGLVRFKVPSPGERSNPPQITGANFVPSVVGVGSGKVRVAWQTNVDRDDLTLTYKLVRNNNNANPIYTTTANSTFWNRPTIGFVDTGLTPGETYTYRVYAVDPSGNSIAGNTVSIVAPDASADSAYDQYMVAQGAAPYWSLGGPTSATVIDSAGFNDGVAKSGVTRGAPGSVIGETGTAATFDGTENGLVTSQSAIPGPNSFAVSAWFRTTTTQGGKIFGFGNANTGLSGGYDRHVYMDNAGRIFFGVYPNSVATVNSSASYNDGQWHQVVASLGSDGMRLSIDGRPVASRSDVTFGQDYSGYWRIGGDNLGSWTSQPTSNYFAGDIDNVAFFSAPLSRTTIRDQYIASGRSLGVAVPTDPYGQAIYNTDPDLYWRLGEASGTTAVDTGAYLDPGTTNNGVTWAQAGAVLGTTDTALRLNGSSGLVVSKKQVDNPTVYTVEAWFKTSSTSGGRIIGFGNSNGSSNTASSNRSGTNTSDRAIYMRNNGQLVFTTNTGTNNQAVSTASYNNNAWHHVVGTQGPGGMRLYVDGALVASHTNTTPADYAGYWRVGGDRLPVSSLTNPSSARANSEYLNGTIDEAAVYNKVLTATQIAQHWNLGTGLTANIAPNPDFNASVNGLTVSFDGSPSVDPDGSVATYRWTFGDGSAQTAASASPTISKTYTKAGVFTVTLTVTDNGGITTYTSKDVVTVDQYGAAVAADDPYLFWRLGESSGNTVARDSSGNNRNANYVNSPTLGVTGSTTGTTQTAAQFDGSNDFGAAQTAIPAPSVYSQEIWFKTTTPHTTGGKMMGFGDSNTGLSGGHDRNIYIDSTGVVRFGVWNGQVDALASQAGLNNGQWHQVVATQGATGMRLYIDGVLVGSNAISTAQAHSAGYWRFGGDTTWQGATYFRGVLANVSVYNSVLSADSVAAHYRANLNLLPPNQLPTASFSESITGLAVNFDGLASSDPDGTIASYAWNFGDSTTGTGATPSHTYAAPGTYTVQLSVTDNRGGTSTTSHTVTVNTINVLPIADFGHTPTGLNVAFDATGSVDPDGSIVSYDWDFGDSSDPGTGATINHVYAAGGTYDVTLTITDNRGGTDSTTIQISTNAPPVAAFNHQAQSNGMTIDFNAGASNDPDGSIASYEWSFGDGEFATGATVEHTFANEGVYSVNLTVTDNQGSTSVVSVNVSAFIPNVLPTASFTTTSINFLDVAFDGSASADQDGTIASYAWNFGDNTSGTGATPSHLYAATGTYLVTLTVTDDEGGTHSVSQSISVEAENVAPVASFSAVANLLEVTFNASLSSDSDGTISSYAWDFGDTTTGTGVTPNHTYAAAGSYTVVLTVTDNDGAINTKSVEVTVAGLVPVAVDNFERTVANGLGSANTGGAWTLGGSTANFNVNGGAGRLRMQAAGAGPSAVLAGVSTKDVNATLDVTLDKPATGGGVFVSLVARRNGTSDYRARIKYLAGGTAQLIIGKVVNGTETTLRSVNLSGTFNPGTVLRLRFEVSGNGTATLNAKAWLASAAEPTAWQNTITDTTPQLDVAGAIGILPYLTGSATNAPVIAIVDNLNVTTQAGVANQMPTAAFTSSANFLVASFNGSTSSDPDGTIASYNWNFGDSTSGTGVSPSHTYAAAGTYNVTLTVIDNQGGTAQVTNSVTVAAEPPPNQNPVAAFTFSNTDLQGSFNAGTSTDSDGTIASYDWNFGDTTSGTGVSTTHTYAAAGTYTVTLTVTDDDGATNSVSHDITVTAPVGPTQYAVDNFGRTVVNGLGTADTGGAWTTTSTSANFNVNNGAGRLRMASAGTGPTAYLLGVSARDTNSTVDITLDKPATGGGLFVSLAARRNGTSEYRARIKYLAGGTAQLLIGRLVNGTETTLRSVNLSGTYNPGDVLRLRFEVSGTGTATLNAKAWLASGTEPNNWQNTITDTTAQLDVAGGVGVVPYLSGSSTNAPVVAIIDNLKVTSLVADVPNVNPVAAFSSSVSTWTATFDSSTSSDSDGTIVGYAWNFGDGATSTAANPSHTYANNGTYNVTLTVTDNRDGTHTVTQPVVINVPNQAPIAEFTSVVTNLSVVFTSTSSDPDGSIVSYAWNFGDGDTSSLQNPSKTYLSDGLYNVSLTVTDNRGGTNTVAHDVEVTTPVGIVTVATDNFGRTVSNGMGTADIGGAYTLVTPGTNFQVSAGSGRIRMNSAGSGPSAYLNSVSARDINATVDVTLDKPATGGGLFVSVAARRVGTSEYRARLKYLSTGAVQLLLGKIVNGTETTLRTVNLTGVTVNPGDVLRLKFEVTGNGTATLNAKAWLANGTEPAAWQNTITDTSPELQGPGAVGLIAYLSGSATNAPVVAIVDNLNVTTTD